MTADEEISEILVSFQNPRDKKPDVKRLAQLLRSGGSLPPGAGAWLADALDPCRYPRHALEINWRLVPEYVGLYEKGQQAIEIEAFVVGKIDAGQKRGLTVTAAIQEIAGEIGKSESSLWAIWNVHQGWLPGWFLKAMPDWLRKQREEKKRKAKEAKRKPS